MNRNGGEERRYIRPPSRKLCSGFCTAQPKVPAEALDTEYILFGPGPAQTNIHLHLHTWPGIVLPRDISATRRDAGCDTGMSHPGWERTSLTISSTSEWLIIYIVKNFSFWSIYAAQRVVLVELW